MAGTKLDGAGTQKMKVIEDALATLQTLHGHVERMAIDVQSNKGAGTFPLQIKRVATSLQRQLQGTFTPIANAVSAMLLAIGRGGSDTLKVRTLREHVAQIRQALEIASHKVHEQHAVAIDSPSDD